MVNGFSYDIAQVQTPGGRITRLTYPSGRMVDYRAGSGMPAAMEFGNTGTANVDNRYDEAGRLTAANPDTPNARTYSYDANGNPSGIEIAAAPWQGRRFDYDNVNRLTGAMGDFGFIDLTYDNTGNRLTHTHNGAESVYSYVPGTNRLDAITPAGGSPIQYSYDGHGNTTGENSRTYTYNAENRLTGISDSELSAQYIYNGLGQRVIKTVDGQSTFYHYDLNGKMIAETQGDGSTHQGTEHIFKGNGLLARVEVADGAIYSYHTNYLGAVHQLVDGNDTVVWEAVYKPFGQAAVNAASTVVNNWRLPGQYYDEESGLYYNYYRYYNPAIGRYMTPDPIGLEGGINRYAYVSNNPVNDIDPYGLLTQSERQAIIRNWTGAGSAIGAMLGFLGGGGAGLLTGPGAPAAVPAGAYSGAAGGAVADGATGAAIGSLIANLMEGSDSGSDPCEGRDPAQDKRLGKGEIKKLKKAGHPHDLKPENQGSRFDLLKTDKAIFM